MQETCKCCAPHHGADWVDVNKTQADSNKQLCCYGRALMPKKLRVYAQHWKDVGLNQSMQTSGEGTMQSSCTGCNQTRQCNGEYLNFQIHGIFTGANQLCLHLLLFSVSVSLPENLLKAINITDTNSVSDGRRKLAQASWIAQAGT